MKKKKGKDPAFLMYSGDFLVGTMTMTNEQVGKYVRLLCLHHQKGFLTETDLKQYLADTDLILFEKFFRADDGNYYNNKMLDVINERKEYTANRLKNFQKKKHKNTHMSSHMDDDMNIHTGDEDEDESQDINQDANQDKNENRKYSFKFCYEVYNELISLVNSDTEFDEYLKVAADQIGWDAFRNVLGLSDTKWEELKNIVKERTNNY